jgi:lipoprotein-anchoring transpeptidase ErfK/SrfK
VRRRSALFLALIAGIAACARAHADPSVGDGDVAEAGAGATAAASPGPAAAAPGTDPKTDASAAEAADAGPAGDPLYAFGVQAPIFSAAEWPPKDPSKAEESRQGVVRLGYIRRGEHVLAKPGVLLSKANCSEGWYELVTGGYVCGRYVTLDAGHKELKFAPHAPYLDRNLPYEYGLNLTPGTPLYRRIPLKSERREAEKALALGKGKKTSDIAKKLKANGEEVPAYLKDTGSEKPSVSFDDLKGKTDLVAQRMLKGFYLSLDKKIYGRSGVFWHTMSGFLAPKDHLIVHEAKTEFEGVVLDGTSSIGSSSSGAAAPRKLPLAFVVGTRARQCEVDVEAKEVKRGDKIDRFSILSLTGKRQAVADRVYHETDKGFWVRDIDVAVVSLPKVPEGIVNGERWVDVDLGSQALVAFEGDKPVYATIVSTGRRNADPEKDHRTVEGSFRIREKHVSTTMDDDGAADGTYRIEDVPWVMYFEKSFALHGAFWHSSFGRERSHGCVNLTPHDARHIFGWAGPSLPDGWHGVRATKENPGTLIVVHK